MIWRFGRNPRGQFVRDYGTGPFVVEKVYDASDRSLTGHPQVLILKTITGEILQKQGHSPGAHVSGALLKKV